MIDLGRAQQGLDNLADTCNGLMPKNVQAVQEALDELFMLRQERLYAIAAMKAVRSVTENLQGARIGMLRHYLDKYDV